MTQYFLPLLFVVACANDAQWCDETTLLQSSISTVSRDLLQADTALPSGLKGQSAIVKQPLKQWAPVGLLTQEGATASAPAGWEGAAAQHLLVPAAGRIAPGVSMGRVILLIICSLVVPWVIFGMRSDKQTRDENQLEHWIVLRTWLLLLALGALSSAAGAVLPTTLAAAGASLGADPSSLEYAALGQALGQIVAMPIWGVLVDSQPRQRVIAKGCALWGAAAIVAACAQGPILLAVASTLGGAALAMALPASQSLIADLALPHAWGRAAGCCTTIGLLGGSVGSAVAAYVANLEGIPALLALPSWRAAFLSAAALSLLFGALLLACPREPKRAGYAGRRVSAVEGMSEVLCTPSAMLLVLQGICNAVPVGTMALTAMWLQYIGFSSHETSALFACVGAGCAVGAIAGGAAGDFASRISPEGGRLIVAQFAHVMVLQLALALFKLVPQQIDMLTPFAGLLLAMGFFMAWPSCAADRPILAEVVDPILRGRAVAFQAAVVGGSILLLGTSLTGYILEYAGDPSAEGTAALGDALFLVVLASSSLATLIYGVLFLTYGEDRARVEQRTVDSLSMGWEVDERAR